MYSREAAIDLSKKFIQDCSNQGIEIERAILFGSTAKDKHTENSDIDIALVSKMFGTNFILNNKMTSKINIKYPLIEVHHFNDEYYEKADPFIDEINKTGIIIN